MKVFRYVIAQAGRVFKNVLDHSTKPQDWVNVLASKLEDSLDLFRCVIFESEELRKVFRFDRNFCVSWKSLKRRAKKKILKKY